MKKKFLLFAMVHALLLGMTGCNGVPISQSNSDSAISENSKDIEELEKVCDSVIKKFPKEITADFNLPKATYEGFEISFKSDDFDIEDVKIHYEYLEEDFTGTITIIVKGGGQSLSENLDIVIKSKKGEIIDQIDADMEIFDDSLPYFITDDYELPIKFNNKYDVVFTVKSNHQVLNNKIIYNNPSKNEDFIFSIKLTDKTSGFSLEKDFKIIIKKFDALNAIPKFYIDTNGQGIWSKEDYVNGKVTIEEPDESRVYNKTLNNAPMRIRGRGNSTWGLPKKPYRIKFDSKTSLFGEPSFKDWVLLANYCDHTLIRNYLAYTLGARLDGLKFTPCCHFVDVYLNNEYQGNYMITDQVEVKNKRVNITQDSAEIDTGYLLELDQRLFDERRSEEGQTWFNASFTDPNNRRRKDVPLDIKYPKTDEEYFSHDQLVFIKDYINKTITALNSNGNWQDYIDLQSAVDFFLVEDLFKNVDSGYASVFMYKDKGTKLFFGPLWDFDLSSLNQGHLDYNTRQYPGWYTSMWDKNAFFYYLMQKNEFKAALKNRWQKLYPTLLDDINTWIDEIILKINDSRVENFKKWDIIGKNRDWYTSDEVYNAKTYDAQIDLLRGWFRDRIGWMNTEINKF